MDWTEADWERLGMRLREARERQGVSRKTLAERAGVSPGSVQSAENGAVPKGRWPQTLSAIERALGWAPDSVRTVLEGGSPSPGHTAAAGPVSSDGLARRMADNQIGMHAASLARDAERLAVSARQYADDLKGGKPAQGGAYQLAVAVTDLLRQAVRLDGMRDIAALVPDADQ